jgi:hypothetical protein
MTDGNTYFETRIIDEAGSHCVYLDRIDDDCAIRNISILPAKRVKGARLCKYEVVGGTPDTLYLRHSTIETSYLHKFLGKTVTFRATSDGAMLPGPVRDEYAYFLDIECDGRVFIEYEVVELSKRARRRRRHVVSYENEKYMDYGKSTPGMRKYTLPMSFDGGGGSGLSKLFAFVPSDATSVEMFIDGEEHGCPFVRRVNQDGKTYYTFDFGECKSSVDDAVLVVRCDGSGQEGEPMGLIGLEEKLLCFAPVA